MMRSSFAAVLWLCAATACSSTPSDDGSADAGPRGDAAAASDCEYAHGGAMQRVDLQGDRFCIDKTEVTRSAYDEFVGAGAPATAAAPPSCEGRSPQKADAECMREPSVCQGDGCGEHPQVCIGLCDAAAYCAWAGKSLCGAVGTGDFARDVGEEQTPTRWELVCGHGLDNTGLPARGYPYGDVYDERRCNVEGGTTAAVGSRAQCGVAEYPAIVDMSGNVTEYTGRIRSISAEATPSYQANGGYFVNEFGSARETSQLVRCNTVQGGSVTANGADAAGIPTLGFRCCAD